ncbi:MAG TPA: ATP-dependent DNA helicase, partial [Ideonella sp.]|nr:ATP-dependent DNA helicase [Ideonella sp.]
MTRLPGDEVPGELAAAVARVFAPGGALAQADAGYAPRDVQTCMAEAVAAAIDDREALVAEAGTGVGKTFAYLVPVLLSGRRTLVSTATKNLQDQLFFRDLPRLRDALKLPATIALLKGRASYLCKHRLTQAREGAMLPDRMAVRALARIETWAHATATGDMGELEGLDERSDVIPLVTSNRDNCLGGECPEFTACHLMRARREAMAADIVVVNHHLFFADLALRDSGVAELLPTVDVAVFDEAHQMVEAGVQFLGQAIGTGQVLDFARDLLAAGLQQARGLAPWAELAGACELAARELRLAAAGELQDVRGLLKRRWDEATRDGTLADRLTRLSEALQQAALALEAVVGTAPDFVRLHTRAQELSALALRFCKEAAPERVRWIDLSPNQARLVESPLDIRAMMGEQRAAASRSWIFTSATLGDDEALSWFCEAAGLDDARKLRVGSPFDYPANARVYVPPRFPAPNEEPHTVMVGRAAAHCAAALGGRTFVLTTTLRALRIAAEALQNELVTLKSPLEVLVQGTAAKRALLSRFQQGNSMLICSHSFWEGIDVPGDALQ